MSGLSLTERLLLLPTAGMSMENPHIYAQLVAAYGPNHVFLREDRARWNWLSGDQQHHLLPRSFFYPVDQFNTLQVKPVAMHLVETLER